MDDLEFETQRRHEKNKHGDIEMQQSPAGGSGGWIPDPNPWTREFEESCKFIRATLGGSKEEAVRIFVENPKNIVETCIGRNGETGFHMAIVASKEKPIATVVEAILSLSRFEEYWNEYLAFATPYGTNALHYAAISGNLEIVKKIHDKNVNLANTRNNENVKPIYLAALAGHSDVIKFFLENERTTFDESDHHGSTVLNVCISAGLFGLAVELVKRHNQSATSKDDIDETALEVLARMPSPVAYKDCFITAFWKKLTRSKESSRKSVKQLIEEIWAILKRSSDLYNTPYLQSLLLTAAENGNHELVVYLLDNYPGLVYTTNGSNQTIFHIAIKNRHEKIFTLIYEIGSLKDFLATLEDEDENTMLHLAAKLSPPEQLSRIHGAALQMQRELLWYKEIEKIVPPSYIERRNKQKETPHDIFIDQHLKLMISGEKWMKRTTQFSMVVSTLIATVVFTTAFTIPGGINNNGSPNFITTKFFDMFVISEIVAMIYSSISLVMYLCILTSRYTEKDFLKSLPFWLTIGTSCLFISLTSMLVAFCSGFLVFTRYHKEYVPFLLAFLAIAPLMFIWFKFPLFLDIINTTLSSKSLSRSRNKLFPGKRWCEWPLLETCGTN